MPSTFLRRKNPSSRRASFDNRLKSFFAPEEFSDREFPLLYKPKTIKKVGDYCYIFHCTVKGNTGNRFNKNMAILVHQNKESATRSTISLINPLRLTSEGEDKLLEFGAVVHIVRLGPSEHAAFEDDYYLSKFDGCQRWAPGPFTGCPHLPLHQKLFDTTHTKMPSLDAPLNPPSPHPDVQVFVFEETVEPECILYLTSKRTILAGDCLQHQQSNPFVNDGATAYLTKQELTQHPVVVSEPWITSQSVVTNNSRKLTNSFKSNNGKRRNSFFGGNSRLKLQSDFQRLLKLDIARLASTSGNHILQGEEAQVKKEITNAVDRVC